MFVVSLLPFNGNWVSKLRTGGVMGHVFRVVVAVVLVTWSVSIAARRAVAQAPPRPVLEVNRESGGIVLRNDTGQRVDIVAYSISSGVGALNPQRWWSIAGHTDALGDGSVDPSNIWFKFSMPGNNSDLSEGTIGELFFSSGSVIDLTPPTGLGPWIRNPVEDLVAQLKLTDGSDVAALIEYVGDGGLPFEVGDLNFDGSVDEADWPVLRDGLLMDLGGLSQAQAYQLGDLNGDGVGDVHDFDVFKRAFVSANGQAAWSQLVPEPGAVWVWFFLWGGLAKARHQRQR